HRVWAWARYHLDDEVIWYATSISARCKAVGSFGAPGQHAPVSWTHASGAIAWKERLAGNFNSKSARSSRKRSPPDASAPPPTRTAVNRCDRSRAAARGSGGVK